MIELSPAALIQIIGGASSETSVASPFVNVQTRESDYARCVQTVTGQVDQAYPRPWPWQDDTQAQSRLKATVDGLRQACGVPGKS